MLENPSARKRLLVLASTFPRWKDDTEPRFVLDLSNELAKTFDVTVLAPFSPGSAVSEQFERVKVRRFKYAFFDAWSVLTAPGSILGNLKQRPWLALLLPLFFLRQIRAIHHAIASGNFDAVHVHWIVPQALSFWVVRWFLESPPFIVTVHGGDASISNLPILRQLAHRALREAEAVAVVAEHLRSKVPEATHVLPMGVEQKRFAAINGRGAPRIFFVGRLARKKGVDILLEALQSLPADIAVHIIGDGEERKSLEALGTRAIFHGPLSHNAIVSILNKSDIICLPFRSNGGLDAEGTPTVLLEMAAAGMAIVSTTIPPVAETVSHRAVYMVKPDDPKALKLALLELINSPEEAGSLGQQAAIEAKVFEWSQVGKRHLDLLELICPFRSATNK